MINTRNKKNNSNTRRRHKTTVLGSTVHCSSLCHGRLPVETKETKQENLEAAGAPDPQGDSSQEPLLASAFQSFALRHLRL